MARQAQLPQLSTRAAVQPATFKADDRTVELTWTTGAQVRRFDWLEGPYLEELSMDPSHIRMSRMGAGAPVLKDHNSTSIDNVIGVVEQAWLEDGQGRAVVRFADDPSIDPIIAKVESGILRNISVGYQVHEYEAIAPQERGGMPTYRAIDWEPVEVSIVAVPADPSAQIRSQDSLHPVSITTRGSDMSDPENQIPADAEAQAPEAPVEAVEAPSVEEAIRSALTTERMRVKGIREHVRLAKLDDDFAEALIDSEKSLDECRSEILRAWSKKVDDSATVSGRPEGAQPQSRAAELAATLLKQVAGVN